MTRKSHILGVVFYLIKNGSPDCLLNIIFELSNQKNIQNDILEAETLQKQLVFLYIVCVLGGNGRVQLSEGMYRGVIGFKFQKLMLIY